MRTRCTGTGSMTGQHMGPSEDATSEDPSTPPENTQGISVDGEEAVLIPIKLSAIESIVSAVMQAMHEAAETFTDKQEPDHDQDQPISDRSAPATGGTASVHSGRREPPSNIRSQRISKTRRRHRGPQ